MSLITQHIHDNRMGDGIEILGYEGPVAMLMIPEEIDGQPVISIGRSAFATRKDIKEVYLPKSLRILKSYCFHECTSLQVIHIFNGVEDYYDGVIKACNNLEEVQMFLLPDEVVSPSLKFLLMREMLADHDRKVSFSIYQPDETERTLLLTFPNYVYDFVEDDMARAIHHKIEGAGYPYRETVMRREIDLRGYDGLFYRAAVDDYRIASMIAIERLMYPVELQPGYRNKYHEYLLKMQEAVGELLLTEEHLLPGMDNITILRFLTDNCLIQQDALADLIELASAKNRTQEVSLLMEYERRHYGAMQSDDFMAMEFSLDDL